MYVTLFSRPTPCARARAVCLLVHVPAVPIPPHSHVPGRHRRRTKLLFVQCPRPLTTTKHRRATIALAPHASRGPCG